MDSIISAISARVLHHRHLNHSNALDNYDGFWGHPTATVDWCERNYEISHYVAEFFNTSSSFAMVVAGIAGVWLHRKTLEKRFLLGLLVVAVVGFGSAAFHGTLWFGLQMLDELPMIYSSLVMSYTMIEQYNTVPKWGRLLPTYLTLHGIITTILVASPVLAPDYASPILQFISFHISFGLLEIFLLFRVVQIWRQETDRLARRLHLIGFGLWCTGIACWILDYAGCDLIWEGEQGFRRRYLYFTIGDDRYYLPNPQLHSWWHICASSGLYVLTIVVAFQRQSILKIPVKLELLLDFLPIIRYETLAAKTKDKGQNLKALAANNPTKEPEPNFQPITKELNPSSHSTRYRQAAAR